jgi:hypothetical protein
MSRLRYRLLFYGLSLTAYLSPLLMIISLATNYWLFSSEKITGSQRFSTFPNPQTTTTTTIISSLFVTSESRSESSFRTFYKSNSTHFLTSIRTSTTTIPINYYPPTDYIEANYGLWRMCRIAGLYLLLSFSYFFLFFLL